MTQGDTVSLTYELGDDTDPCGGGVPRVYVVIGGKYYNTIDGDPQCSEAKGNTVTYTLPVSGTVTEVGFVYDRGDTGSVTYSKATKAGSRSTSEPSHPSRPVPPMRGGSVRVRLMYTASWGDVVRRDLFGPSPDPRDRPYRFVIRLCLIVYRLFRFRFDVRGSEHVPTTGGAIIASNHVSFLDFTFLGLGALPRHRLVRFMAKAAVFDHWLAGPAMRAMKHIPVDRRAGTAAFESAVRALKDGEIVGIFPEATISTSFVVKDIKAGAARMAMDSGVPLVPAAVWGGQRIATKGLKVRFRRGVPVTVLLGEPIVPEPGEKPQVLLRRLKAAMQELLDDAQRSYPDVPAGPEDRWWLPAHLGGTAPTPEVAAVRDTLRATGREPKELKRTPMNRLKARIRRRR